MFATKVFILLGLTFALANAQGFGNLGGPQPITDLVKSEQELSKSLTKLAAADGPYYKLGKIYSGTYQVVAGAIYDYVADLIDTAGTTRKCNVNVLTGITDAEGVTVTFECEGLETITKKHSV